MDRREAVTTMAGLLGAALSSRGAGQLPREEIPTMHNYEGYGWLRGFSVVPSWGARIEEAWWRYDGARFRKEVALARTAHANCLRVWIEFTAWMADPDAVTASFLDAVAAIDESGMKTMPCIFNRWHDARYDYGGQYTEDLYRDWSAKLEYVRALVTPLAADARVLMWDLCNEPQAANLNDEWAKREFEWLRQVAETVRASGAQQPITIGTMYGSNIETFAPLCDVLCAHPYGHTPEALRDAIASYDDIRSRLRKPMVSNECIPGCLDDLRRAEVARFYSEMLATAGYGWMGWALREGKAISTRRDRYDANGLDGQGFHPFFTAEGRLREGLDFLREAPALKPPWEA